MYGLATTAGCTANSTIMKKNIIGRPICMEKPCMQLLRIFDEHNYDPCWRCFDREAVRAVIVKNGRIALVRSEKEDFYKFPGGGIEQGETHMDTLIRETREETGLRILPESVRAFGMIRERRRDMYEDGIFEQKSYYYLADIGDTASAQALDGYEAELGFKLEWTDIEKAHRVNAAIGRERGWTFLNCEIYVLKLLLDKEQEG